MMEKKLNLEIEVNSLMREHKKYADLVKTKKWEYSQIKSLVDKTNQTFDDLNNKLKEVINEISDKRLKFETEVAEKIEALKIREVEAENVINQGKILAEKEQKLAQKQVEIDKKEQEIDEKTAEILKEKDEIEAQKQTNLKEKQANLEYKDKLNKDFEDKLKKAKEAFINNL